jgi:hypothetical protein
LKKLASGAEDEGAKGEEQYDPGDGDKEASVDRLPLQSPATREHTTHRLAGKSLRQHIAQVPANA